MSNPDEDDELYRSIFGPHEPEPLTEAEQQLWDAMFGPRPATPLTDTEQQVWDAVQGIADRQADELAEELTGDPAEDARTFELQRGEWTEELTVTTDTEPRQVLHPGATPLGYVSDDQHLYQSLFGTS